MIKEETEDTNQWIDMKETVEIEMAEMKEKDQDIIEITHLIDIEEEKEAIAEKIDIEEKEVEAEAIATEDEEIQEEDTQMKEMIEIITKKEDIHHQDQDHYQVTDQLPKDLILVQVEVNKIE